MEKVNYELAESTPLSYVTTPTENPVVMIDIKTDADPLEYHQFLFNEQNEPDGSIDLQNGQLFRLLECGMGDEIFTLCYRVGEEDKTRRFNIHKDHCNVIWGDLGTKVNN